MNTFIICIVVLIFLIISFIFFICLMKRINQCKEYNKGFDNNKNNYLAKPLMTGNEFEFFNRLIEAFPEYYIFPQVSLGAILQGDSEDFREKNRIRLTFSQKIADFIIYNKEQKIMAIIELDDKTHNLEKDKKRDDMLNLAGYKTLRFNSKFKPSIEELKKIDFNH